MKINNTNSKNTALIVIDPGHGGKDSGASYMGVTEKEIVLRIAKVAAREISSSSKRIMTVLTREYDIFKTLQERCDIANESRANAFVSIHCNADPDPDLPGMSEARGEEIWVYRDSTEARVLADYMKDEVDLILPDEPFRGIKGTDSLYVLKHTKCPACLIEVGFIDNSSSLESFLDGATISKIGGLIASGIVNYVRNEIFATEVVE